MKETRRDKTRRGKRRREKTRRGKTRKGWKSNDTKRKARNQTTVGMLFIARKK
jgi:hypothetical protein